MEQIDGGGCLEICCEVCVVLTNQAPTGYDGCLPDVSCVVEVVQALKKHRKVIQTAWRMQKACCGQRYCLESEFCKT